MTDQKEEKTAPPAKSEPVDTAPAKSADQQPRKLDETIPGGRYLNQAGQLVDANGVPLKDKKEA